MEVENRGTRDVTQSVVQIGLRRVFPELLIAVGVLDIVLSILGSIDATATMTSILFIEL